MKPAFSLVGEDREKGTYGDCVRACIASILELPTDEVPHFFHDRCDGTVGNARIVNFLKPRGFAPLMINFDGALALDDLLNMMELMNRDTYYILFGATETGNHAVVYRGGKMAHNPSWTSSPIVGPIEEGVWSILVIAKS